MFKIMGSLLNDCRKYPNVLYGLATGSGLAKLGQAGSGIVKCWWSLHKNTLLAGF